MFSLVLAFTLAADITPTSPAAEIRPPSPELALTVAQTLRDPEAAFQAGMAAFQANDYEAAIAAWQIALEHYEALDNVEQAAVTNNALAAAAISMGRFQTAIAFAQRSVELAQSLDNPILEAQALGNLGIAYQSYGAYNDAVITYEAAISLLRSQTASAAIAQLHSLLGNTYEALGDYDSAISAQQTSLAIAREAMAATQEATALMNLGGLYSLRGEYDRAIQNYETGIALATEINNLGSAAYGFNNLGGTYQKLAQHESALAHFRASLELAQQTQNLALQASVLTNMGVTFETQGQLDAALTSHQASIQIARRLEEPRLLASVLNNLANTQYKSGNLSAAAVAVEEAISLLSSLRTDLADADKVNVFDTQIYTYNLLMQIQVAQQQYEAALETSELGRARAFVELLAKDNQALTVPQIDHLRETAQTLDATIVEYAVVPDDAFVIHGQQRGRVARIFVWVIAPTGEVTFQEISLDGIDLSLEEQVQQSRSAIGALGRTRSIGVVPTETPQSSPRLNELYNRLIAPIADALPSDPEDLVVLVPHESLFYLPFAALQDNEGRYLIERHTLLTTPAIQLLELTLAPPMPTDGAAPLVVGNPTMPPVPSLEGDLQPLPGAEAEAAEIADLFQTQAILGGEATEAQIAAAMPQANIIHLATHGLLDYVDTTDRIPIPGAIALAPDDTDDGLLTAREIADLSLSAQLVVLSACDTGLGEVTGDGVVGLSRSLLAAGAQSTVVSLWSVPDEPTAALMQAFYTELWNGANKAQALRQAMLQTQANYPDPINWAAFVLIGNPAPLE